ncbi:hypothetical protein VPH35_028004 [Triticum aestivum]
MALDLQSMDIGLAALAASYLGGEEAVKKPDSSPSAGEGKVLIFRRRPITQDSPSLNPPAYGYPDGGGDQPSFVLIEPYAFFADRRNATTADCGLEGLRLRGNIEVTFCTAQPPQVSYLCFHVTAYDHNVFATRPSIVATETDGGLVLLCVVVGDCPSDALYRGNRHYFVYDATRQRPPRANGFRYGNPSHLCLYDHDTNSWSKLPVNVDSVPDADEFITYKAITIGGDEGTVAWVDLSHMIIFCNVLDKHPKPHFLRLPSNATRSPAVRDVSVLNGFIKMVELEHRAIGWKATIWSIKTGIFSKAHWSVDCQFDSSAIPEPPLPKLKVREGVTAQPTLALHIGLPKLSLQDDCILYLLAKIDYRDRQHTSWVLAVDMKNNTVQRVAEFSPKRAIGLARGYDSSTISKYLKVGPGELKRAEQRGTGA